MSYARVNLHDVDDVEMSQMEGAAQAPHGVLPQPLQQQPHLQLLHAAPPAGPHDELAPIFAGERVDEEADIVAFRTRLVSRRVNMTAVRYMTDAWGMVKRNIPFFFLLGLGYLVLVLLPFAPAVFFWFKMMMQEFGMHGRHGSDGGSGGSGGNGADDSRGGSGSWPSMSSLAFEAPNELPAPHDGYAFDFIAWALIGLTLELFVSVFILLPMRASLTRAIFDSMRSDGVLRVRTALCWAYACPFCGRLLMLATVIGVPQVVLSSIFFPAALIWMLLTMLAVPMFIDNEERLTLFECVTNSVSVMSRYIFGSLRWVLMSVVVAFLGALCLGVGLFLAVPVIFISQMFMYHHLVGVRGCVLEPSLAEVAAPPRAAPVAAVAAAAAAAAAPASAGNVMAVVPASAQGYAMAPMTHAAPVMYPLAPSGAYAQAAAFHPAPPMAHPSMYAQAYPGMMAAAPPPSYLPAHDLHAHAAMYPGAMVYAVPMASDPHASASAPPPVNPYAV